MSCDPGNHGRFLNLLATMSRVAIESRQCANKIVVSVVIISQFASTVTRPSILFMSCRNNLTTIKPIMLKSELLACQVASKLR